MTRYLAVILALILSAVAAMLFTARGPGPRSSDGYPKYPPAPSAAEESGEEEPGSSRPHAPASSPRSRVERPRFTAPVKDPVASGDRVPAEPSEPQLREEDRVPAPRGRAIRESEGSMTQAVSGGQQGAAESAQTDGSGRAPVLMPPILRTPVADYPEDGYRIVLDRAAPAPRLQVEAAQGRVVLRILVRVDGRVGPVDVVESSGDMTLDEAAVRAAARWTFVPATRDGVPIDAWALIAVRFTVP